MDSDIPEMEYNLRPETELRFAVAEGSEVTMVMKQGLAEIFGTEVLIGKNYIFDSGSKITVFTHHGCTILLTGRTESAETMTETPMIIYANIHAAIEQMRQIAAEKCQKGPSVMVVGPKDVGKSTMCKYLVNYAVRQGWVPTFVDLDVGQGQLSIPATVGAVVVRQTIDIEEGFVKQMPVVYHVGHKSPGHNIVLYNKVIARLSTKVKSKLKKYLDLSASGIIINTCGWVKNEGYQAITKAIVSFEVDVILVLGKENLYYQITRDVPSFVKVVYVPKFDAIVERSRPERYAERDSRVCAYFYGYRRSLQPYTFEVNFSHLNIYKIILKQEPNDNIHPEAKYLEDNLYAVPFKVGFNLLNHILSVTFTSEVNKNIIHQNLSGFICVTQVDMGARRLSILSPEPPPLPDVILLYTDVMFTQQL